MIAALAAFGAALILILARIPIALGLGIVGFIGLYAELGWRPARTVAGLAIEGSTMAYSLSVLPLFVLMGSLVAGAGISGKLFTTAQAFLGHRKGGLANATIVACGGFGAICGSSVATAATMSRIAIPSMRKYGYRDSLTAGTLAAGGTLGILIPPSVVMIVYAVATQSHIGKLFAAGVIPGVIGVLGYMAAIRWSVWRDPEAHADTPRVSWGERMRALKSVWQVVLLFGLVMGGIYSGFFTATEAAGIGAFGALLLAIFSKGLGWRGIWQIVVDSALVSTSMFFILFGASIFVEFINLTGIHTYLNDLVTNSGMAPITIIFVMVGIYILLGCFLESISMILITIPVFFPIVTALGFDPIWFGLIVVVACEIGLITPPIGINLFVIQTMQPDIRIQTVFRGVVPFIIADIIRVSLLILAPALVLWLPNLLF
ncbi:TRAP transporter large permease [Mesobacterium pallidum]|uniref:TRAP transporter large permease n=1 Tax=Mesobacterium pallidum TaxID=2872037 RepID=UPI001EE18223|nr:TRAP transporter large permease [Mesobacterium pallidum]